MWWNFEYKGNYETPLGLLTYWKVFYILRGSLAVLYQQLHIAAKILCDYRTVLQSLMKAICSF